MNNIKSVFSAINIVIPIILCSCATFDENHLSESHVSIKSIAIRQSVSIVEKPFVQTPSQLWGNAVAGVVGGAIGGKIGGEISGTPNGASIGASNAINDEFHRALTSKSSTNEEQFKSMLEANNIDIRAIVYQQFKNKLTNSIAPLQIKNADGDAELLLNINLYEIHPSSPVSSSLEPMLSVQALLNLRGGQTVWSTKESMMFPNEEEVTPHTSDEYRNNITLLADGYARLADLISTKILSELNHDLAAATSQ